MGVINLTAEDKFAELTRNQQGIVIVDFWAPWCAPCRMLASELAGAGEEFGEKLQVLKVNIDDFADLASAQYKVLGVPTLVLFKDGQEKDRLVGYRPKAAIKEFIEKHL
ncbi:MAG: thioredoxin [Acidaminococcales bacterium]|jgi:thioredoxin 1|nr:thioredoxin [Acidaminococcales bacterium]